MSIISRLSVGLELSNLNNSSQRWLVMGNEACDLDSAVSSIAYALFLSYTYPSIFVLNVKRSDFALKTEVVYFLKKHMLAEDNIVFRDDLEFINGKVKLNIKNSTTPNKHQSVEEIKYWEGLQKFKKDVNDGAPLSVCLVDHHRLAKQDESFDQYVDHIIDHHPCEGSCSGNAEVSPVIATVGSCCTLVTEIIHKTSPYLFTEVPEIASLLYGCILLDTVNMSVEAGRGTPRDAEAIAILNKDSKLNRDVYNELEKVKSDISSLSSVNLLRRDVKLAANDVSISALPITVWEFLHRPDSIESLQQYCADNGYSIAVVMGIKVIDNIPSRDIALFTIQQNERLHKLCSYIEDHSSPCLDLTPWGLHQKDPLPMFLHYRQLLTDDPGLKNSTTVEQIDSIRECSHSTSEELDNNWLRSKLSPGSDLPTIQYYWQNNVKASRKQVMPIIKEFIAQSVCQE